MHVYCMGGGGGGGGGQVAGTGVHIKERPLATNRRVPDL